MFKKLSVFSLLFLAAYLGLIYVSAPIFCQTEETESRVEELEAFHEIIYPIWHTAYPEKDYAALRDYVSEINRLAENLFAAQLPGILRDKKTRWAEGLEDMKQAVEDYNKAAAGKDDQALLDAAEALHARYEMMVRIIRPVLKEVDEFHKVLYIVYHRYLPEKKFDEIGAVSDDLIQKAEAITGAALPKRLEEKAGAFSVATKDLWEASQKLKETCLTEDTDAIQKAVEFLHAKYQDLEKIFD